MPLMASGFLAKLCNALAVSGLPQPISICSIFTNLRKVKTNDEYPQDKKDLLLTAQQLGFVGTLTFLYQDAFHIFLHILPGSFINIWQACNLHGGSILAEQVFRKGPFSMEGFVLKKKTQDAINSALEQLKTSTKTRFTSILNPILLSQVYHFWINSTISQTSKLLNFFCHSHKQGGDCTKLPFGGGYRQMDPQWCHNSSK